MLETKLCSRSVHPENTVISVGGVNIGGEKPIVIAGPCAVESEAQIIEIAKRVKAAGADILRGGAFKPRTSPYDFQGLGAEGISYLVKAKRETGLPLITEIVDARDIELFEEVDIIQIGSRSMQNYSLLKTVGKLGKPVLLKRGISATYEELLLSAEYLMAEGNDNIILCERGIRSFENYTRNTLDIAAIPVLKELSHLPVAVDPSHAAGRSEIVAPLAKASLAAGADALMIEVHSDPANALSDGRQSLSVEQFEELMKEIRKY